jgi:ABC-2 type transport system ATP-binding protein
MRGALRGCLGIDLAIVGDARDWFIAYEWNRRQSGIVMQPLVEMTNLTRDYGWWAPKRALNQLNLTVNAGEVVGLLGPNGSGKSTALRLLLGFMRPTAGTVRLGGFDPWNQGPMARKTVSYLPGELRLYDNLSALELCQFLGKLHGGFNMPRAVSLARAFDLDLATPLSSCSSGMKRKAALISILALDTRLLVLDEPTNTLDPAMRECLLDQIRLAKLAGKSVLFSSHVLEEVEKVCDRVVILQKGQLAASCASDEMRSGRKITARIKMPLLTPPPDGEGLIDQSQGERLIFEVSEVTPEMLRWLADQPLDDLRIEPAAVSRLYRSIHPDAV